MLTEYRSLSTDELAGIPARAATNRFVEQLHVRAFGQSVDLYVTPGTHLRDDSYWRLRSIYEPALASQSLAIQGVALDIGAGFGCFSIPFARAYPHWTIWAFEPEPEAFEALCQNIASIELGNIVAINAAVAGFGPEFNWPGQDVTACMSKVNKGDPDAAARLPDLLPRVDFRRHIEMRGVIECRECDDKEFEACSYPALPPDALLFLNPNLLKLTAPFAEISVLTGLKDAPLDHIIGESWTYLPSDLIFGTANGMRQTWIPQAGEPFLSLRRSNSPTRERAGLDVVVAMFNARHWIKECVDGILNSASAEIRVLVVDDGSTDGSGEVVKALYGNNNQVILLTKPNGGCASARNFGRMHSDASHIAFVDADDLPGPGLFAGLLELARYTGAEIVQGGFDLLHADPNSQPRIDPSYEVSTPDLVNAKRHPFGERTCLMAPSWLLIQGQPSIWRRVYRRDYLDNRNIWFPEHIRAFDDQIFQLLTLQQVTDVPMLDGVNYHYRQHGKQDIRQGDERVFYSLEMFRMMLKRGVSEGWNDFHPMLRSFVNTVNWSWSNLRQELRPAFERGAAELWVYAQNTLGAAQFQGLPDDGFAPPDFSFFVTDFRKKSKALHGSYASVYLDSIDMHVGMVSARHR
ncbi:MAG: FkbM family methyltransferase [bacterium]